MCLPEVTPKVSERAFFPAVELSRGHGDFSFSRAVCKTALATSMVTISESHPLGSIMPT